jgi:flagellum-specific ATP synthase
MIDDILDTKLDSIIDNAIDRNTHINFGRIININATTIIATGLDAAVGDVVEIVSESHNHDVLGMIVTMQEKDFTIVPFSFIEGFTIKDRVYLRKQGLKIDVGNGLLGRVVDALGSPIDGLGKIKDVPEQYPIIAKPIFAMERKVINEPFYTGVKAIDSTLTSGNGQKVGIFAGSGVGKSTLMGMIVKGSKATIKVVALIGERGREIPEFIDYNLNKNLSNTIIVAATSDESALMRKFGAFSAMAIAEYFRDQGHDVLLMMDSVTRFAMAQREIGLSIGEPPVARGYPPSVFALLPQLMERAGARDVGSITAFFTVLVDGDDMSDPIADQSRSILDGHIVLSREISEMGLYPPINQLKSASRVMDKVTDKIHYANAHKLRRYIAIIKENEVLIKVGAYQKGTDKELDEAMAKKDMIQNFLGQSTNEQVDTQTVLQQLNDILN